jgi:tetratricopeptide (TPR) repeat protein
VRLGKRLPRKNAIDEEEGWIVESGVWTALTLAWMMVSFSPDAAPGSLTGPSAPAQEAMLLTEDASAVMLDRGRREVLSGYFAAGEATFYQLAARPDGGPAAYHHLATTSLLRVLLFDRPEDYETFFGRSDSLRKVLARQSRSRGKTYLNAETDFQRSIAWTKQGNYVRAAMAAVSAYRAMSGLLEADSTFFEAYKTLGIVHAAIGTLARRYRRFLSVFGFETNIEIGLSQLETAASNSVYGKEESLLFLAVLDSFEFPSRVDASSTLEALRLQFDQSPLFGMVQADALLRNRRVVEAEAVLDTLPSGILGQVELDYLAFYRADVDFKQERWRDAAAGYHGYLESHKGTALMAIASLREGLALEMAGRRADAEVAYGRVVAARAYDSDEASERRARARLSRPMTEDEKTLHRARMSHDRADYPRADSLLAALALRVPASSENLRAEIAYRRGRTLDESGSTPEALEQYALGIANPGDPSAKWAAYGLYYTGRIHDRRGQLELARQSYRAVLDYKPSYDYQGTNEQRARFALERLGK